MRLFAWPCLVYREIFCEVTTSRCCFLSAWAAASSSAFAFFSCRRSSAACCRATFAASACCSLYNLRPLSSLYREISGVGAAWLRPVSLPRARGLRGSFLETRRQHHHDTLCAVEGLAYITSSCASLCLQARSSGVVFEVEEFVSRL